MHLTIHTVFCFVVFDYLRLEKDFIEALNYVEFAEDNYSTYSIEFEKMLLSICSEVDVLCKLLCKEIRPSESPSKILEYAPILCGYSGFSASEVRFERIKKTFLPFKDLTLTDTPSWWKAYNKVKHERTSDDNYKKGNLENVFLALVGLYALNRQYFKKLQPQLFLMSPFRNHNFLIWRDGVPVLLYR